MTLSKPPSGTRGNRATPAVIARFVMPLMKRIHRRSGDTYAGMDLIYLTTVGANSGKERHSTVARFDDGHGGWFIVASAGGPAGHPAWYHNIAAHPDQVIAQVGAEQFAAHVEQLAGADRDDAWAQIVAAQERFDGYARATDRAIPVLRLTPEGTSPLA